MKDENIKEILEDVKRHLDYVEATKQCSIRDNEMKVMYDYITNLQEENEYSDYCNEKLREKIANLEYKITNLQKKYEEADYDRHKLFEAKEKLQNDYQEAVDKITNLQEENERLKGDNEFLKKELIKLERKYLKDDLLNILQGCDE